MGQVFAGLHEATQTPVVLKFLNAEIEAQVPWANLDREIRAQAGLDHPNIVVIVDFGRVNDIEAAASNGKFSLGQAYIVMEKGELGSLERRLAKPVSWLFVKRVLLAVLDGLAHAHARGVIHRDIKPANVIGFENPMRWKLTDFGIAHQAQDGTENQATVVGTPQYMAPEQFIGAAHDFGPPTDLYALGCVAWQMVTGVTPFLEEGLMALANAHSMKELPELESKIHIPDGFEAWVKKLLAKSPWERFQFAADAAWELSKLSDLEANTSSSLSLPAPSLHTLGWDEETTTLVSEPPEMLVGVADPTKGPPPPCPFPGDWRRFVMASVNPLFGLSSALFNVRPAELVAREQERDRLWNMIARTSRSKRAHICVLKAPIGRGKTVLAQWFAERLLESGAANVVRVKQGQSPYAAVMEHMSLPGGEQASKVRTLAQRLGIGPEDIRLKWWLEMLDDARVPEAAASYIQAQAKFRPLLFWVDDIEENEEALGVIDKILESQDSTSRPVFILACVDTDGLVARASIESWLRSVEAHPLASVIELAPLTALEVTQVVESLLILDESAKMSLLLRAGTDPTLVTHLVQDWIRNGWLELQKNRVFSLNVDVSTASTSDSSWEERTKSALQALNSTERSCILAAAVLGLNVSKDEWATLLSRLNLTAHGVLVPSLVDAGLGVWSENGWSFTHPYVREAVFKLSPPPAVRQWHIEAAKMLRERTDLDALSRLAHHLFEAQEFSAAVRAHDRAAKKAAKRGNLLLACQHTQAYLQILSAFPDREDEALLAKLRFSELTRRRLGYYLAEEEENLQQIIARASETKWPEVEFHALQTYGDFLTDQRRWDESKAVLNASIQLGEKHGWNLWKSVARLADCHFYAGELQESYDTYVKALDYVETEDNLAWCHFGVGYVLLLQGLHSKAREHLTEAKALYESQGDPLSAAAVKSSIADLDRYEKRYDVALTKYHECLEVQNQSGRVAPNLHINIAQAAFAKGDVELGILHANKVLRVLGLEKVDKLFPQIPLLVAAAEGDWKSYERLMKLLNEKSKQNVMEFDFADAAEVLARLLEARGDAMRAYEAYQLAGALWKAHGDHGRGVLCELEADRLVMMDPS